MKISISIPQRVSFFVLPLLFLVLYLSCNHDSVVKNPQEEAVFGKLMPNDWFFRQRAYPTGIIDGAAAREAFQFRKEKMAANKVATRGGGTTNPWEFCGPTNVGGRITDIEMASGTPNTIYVAAASGGIFTTQDMGASWVPVFDEAESLSIGDMAIAPTDQSILYVGTGEANAGGGSLAYDGNGVYRSDDGGTTWNHLGLSEVGSIGRVMVSNDNPDVCFVGAMGHLFDNNPERGLYRTVDGGSTWDQVLFINDSTGVIDLAIDPLNPNTVYAAAWERVRRVNRRSYGGPSSGIFKSTDGGDTWQELTNGLPGNVGRIGIALAPSDPSVLYAIYTNTTTSLLQGIYKTTDGGNAWQPVSIAGISDVPFMWWFGKIFVHPSDPDEVYVASLNMHKSINGGASWQEIFTDTHVDQHALCFDPANPEHLILGNDGGAYFSTNGGESYVKLNGLPINQFYACEMDFSFPERIYGGLQDNGTHRTLTGSVDDWEHIYWGDGFRVLVDPVDNTYVYAEYQYGNFARSVNGGSSFFDAVAGISNGDRRNWNTPAVFNPEDPSILYLGTNRLYKSINRAVSWSAISPDLTGNPPQNNLTFGTITAIDVSPINTDIIYVGTDDGHVQISLNDGVDWTDLSGNLPNRWVTSVVADPDDVDVAYVAFSGYRFGEDLGHIYQTIDQGNTWMDISGDLPDAPINDLIVRPVFGELYIATDVGVYYSLNGGANWELLGTELPNVVVTDLDFHEPESILLAATYGRGMYKVVLEEPVGISESVLLETMKATAFPNPFQGRTTIELEVVESQEYAVSVFSSTGKLVRQFDLGLLDVGLHRAPIDLSGLPSGKYDSVVKGNATRASISLLKTGQ